MGILSREALLKATAPPQQIVAVPELGGDVIVRGMTGTERDAFEAGLIVGKGKHRDVNMTNMRAKLVAFCCIDEAGAPLFSPTDVEALGRTRADVLNRLYTPAAKLSGITEEDAEDLGKPSSPAASASSSSASRVN